MEYNLFWLDNSLKRFNVEIPPFISGFSRIAQFEFYRSEGY
jgi:hypothetical protein